MAYIVRTTRVGRSQGASIFWGLVSVCFAAAACFYYGKSRDYEKTADQMRDQAIHLTDEAETLNSQKVRLQANQAEAESQLKTREDLVQEKETELAAEENRLEGLEHQSQAQSQENLAQVPVVKKFNDLIRNLGKDNPPDVVERGGRPVLRVPNSELFAPGDATLTPAGKALLGQIAQALNGQLNNFELRVVSYTDSNVEAEPDNGQKKDASTDSKPHYATSWDLTAARATVIARFYRDESPLPFLSVLVMGRGDAEPIVSNAGENHARNRRVEITVTPVPVAFRSPDLDKAASAADTDPLAPPSDSSAAGKEKAKEKKADKDKSTGH
ncbi:MAG: OmpA family protein [Methylacidiphilales bacterium]|nr:OmpA family protein [Candidatus Methylacidiphilales bacterium]